MAMATMAAAPRRAPTSTRPAPLMTGDVVADAVEVAVPFVAPVAVAVAVAEEEVPCTLSQISAETLWTAVVESDVS
jgi:hypothetical protein